MLRRRRSHGLTAQPAGGGYSCCACADHDDVDGGRNRSHWPVRTERSSCPDDRAAINPETRSQFTKLHRLRESPVLAPHSLDRPKVEFSGLAHDDGLAYDHRSGTGFHSSNYATIRISAATRVVAPFPLSRAKAVASEPDPPVVSK